MDSLSSEEAKNRFADTLNHVADASEHIAINRPGKEPVYIIPAKDYELFLKLLQQAEDNLDLQEAEERRSDPQQERVGFDDFFAELEVECG
jgi:prevent-host-death family protein